MQEYKIGTDSDSQKNYLFFSTEKELVKMFPHNFFLTFFHILCLHCFLQAMEEREKAEM